MPPAALSVRLSRTAFGDGHDPRSPFAHDDWRMDPHRQTPPDACSLEAALGVEAPCPGATCPLWDDTHDVCALHGVRADVLSSPELAEHLLALRRALESAAAAPEDTDDTRRQFFHRLNLGYVDKGGTT